MATAATGCATSGEEGDGGRGIIHSILRADGAGASYLERSVGGTRFPFGNGSDPLGMYLKMDGRQVYNFAVKVVSEGIVEMLESSNLTVNDCAWIVPHQANARIIEAAGGQVHLRLHPARAGPRRADQGRG